MDESTILICATNLALAAMEDDDLRGDPQQTVTQAALYLDTFVPMVAERCEYYQQQGFFDGGPREVAQADVDRRSRLAQAKDAATAAIKVAKAVT